MIKIVERPVGLTKQISSGSSTGKRSNPRRAPCYLVRVPVLPTAAVHLDRESRIRRLRYAAIRGAWTEAHDEFRGSLVSRLAAMRSARRSASDGLKPARAMSQHDTGAAVRSEACAEIAAIARISLISCALGGGVPISAAKRASHSVPDSVISKVTLPVRTRASHLFVPGHALDLPLDGGTTASATKHPRCNRSGSRLSSRARRRRFAPHRRCKYQDGSRQGTTAHRRGDVR